MHRMTEATLAILRTVKAAEGPTCGAQITRVTGYKSGVVSPVLRKFEECGWLVSEWEPHPGDRPRRRYFRFTASGVEAARVAFAGSRVAGRLGVVFPADVTD